jgi:hypothetical protein
VDRALKLRLDRRKRKLPAPVAYHPPALGRAAARAAAMVLSSPSDPINALSSGSCPARLWYPAVTAQTSRSHAALRANPAHREADQRSATGLRS